MNARRRIMAIGLVTALPLTACGGDDDSESVAPAPAPESESTGDGGGSAEDASTDDAPSGGEPTPTIAPDLPDEFLDGVGPVVVVGETVPPYLLETEEDQAVGMVAPVLIGETFDGEPVRIDATVDGPTWMIFLAHWCPHCNDEIPVINQMRDDGRIPDEVNVVGVSTAYNPDRPNWPPDEWLEDLDWKFPAVPDGIDTVRETYIAAADFGIGGFPFSMLIDGDGTITARWSGERTADELESLLNDNLTLS